MKNRPTPDETSFWVVLAIVFPLIVYPAGYENFHEPKWLILTVFAGLMLVYRALAGRPIFGNRTPLEPPLWFCLVVTLFALRWSAGDRMVALAFWARLGLMYLLFRLWVTWLTENEGATFEARLERVLDAFVLGSSGVGALAILQDWGYGRWSDGMVPDWRFNLPSTLGNPNEVGGYLSYLIPILLVRCLVPRKSLGAQIGWGIVLLLALYALTTVFTVGAWLGLFAVLPLSLCLIPSGKRSSGRLLFEGYALSILGFGLLRGSMQIEPEGYFRPVFFGTIALCLILLTYFVARANFFPNRHRALLAVSILVGVWTVLLPSWGIKNHPKGLIEEALMSPRWQGGFGARRFIWRTTGLMVKDHPLAGIGWGHYYSVHALYQGELYRQRDLPHDRPTVGLVPQVHSDPLQMIAEAGVLGGIGFFWLAAAAFRLGAIRVRGLWQPRPNLAPNLLACWGGLGLIAFHCAVDFPLRQPQPAVLATFFLAALAAIPGRRAGKIPVQGSSGRIGLVLAGAFLIVWGMWGLRDQTALKSGFEHYGQSLRVQDPRLRDVLLETAASALDSIRYPLPETHDRWIYRARVAMEQGSVEEAKRFLQTAADYRHSLGLYQAWLELGRLAQDPKVTLGAIRGLQIYNPCWGPFYRESAKLEQLLGNDREAREDLRLAGKFAVRKEK